MKARLVLASSSELSIEEIGGGVAREPPGGHVEEPPATVEPPGADFPYNLFLQNTGYLWQQQFCMRTMMRTMLS